MHDPPTKDFLRWDKVRFRDGEKQNPGPNSGATMAPKVGPYPPSPLAPKSGAISRLTILPAEKEAQRQSEEEPTIETAHAAIREAA
jgi:hypothetical protein